MLRISKIYYLSLLIFLDKEFTFQATVCNGSRDVLMMSIDSDIIAILNIHGVGCRCIIS